MGSRDKAPEGLARTEPLRGPRAPEGLVNRAPEGFVANTPDNSGTNQTVKILLIMLMLQVNHLSL